MSRPRRHSGVGALEAALTLLWLLAACLVPPFPAAHAAQTVAVEAIVRSGCRHCEAEKAFLQTLREEDNGVSAETYDIATAEGGRLFRDITQTYGLPLSLPITAVGGELLQGFDSAETTGARIRALVAEQRGNPVQGFAALLAAAAPTPPPQPPPDQASLLVKLPALGVVDVAAWPLPALASVLGFLDGFNPCAMWVLVTFLLALTRVGSKRRMWTVAGLFILAEAVMYYLILNVWFRVWDFIGLSRYVTPAVGILAVCGGLFFLYEWYKSLGTEMACRIASLEQRSLAVQSIKQLADAPLTLLTAAGIVALAFSVNVAEFACSIGYPQTFTKIIELNRPGIWATQFYLGIYILFYMADDFAVFGLALWGFDRIRLTQSYSRWSSLLGGLLLLLLGTLLWFRPDWLRFG
ncbi:hypothetical protein [Methylogaea oryzae]|uniref:hypothetical protein n=1 Tax=Methylogaea oryzae TaxID=1295382 RepID=UPI001C7EEF73|nr:hypothetical protein [Methylogaea oryzae]